MLKQVQLQLYIYEALIRKIHQMPKSHKFIGFDSDEDDCFGEKALNVTLLTVGVIVLPSVA